MDITLTIKTDESFSTKSNLIHLLEMAVEELTANSYFWNDPWQDCATKSDKGLAVTSKMIKYQSNGNYNGQVSLHVVK